MDDTKEYSIFKFLFHVFIFIIGIGLMILSIVAWGELDRALLYLILGIALVVESTVGLYKYFKRR